MERRVQVKGSVSEGVLKWLEEAANKAENKVERVKQITEKMKDILKLKEIKKGGVLSWIKREPLLVEIEGVKARVGSTLTVGKDKKKTVRGRLELPNILSKVFEVSNLLLEGSIKSIKGSLSIGEMNRNWKKEETLILYKWRIEGEAEEKEKRVSLFHGLPGVNAASRRAIGASLVRKEETDISAEVIHSLLTEKTKSFLQVSLGRTGKEMLFTGTNYLRLSSSLQGVCSLFSLHLPEGLFTRKRMGAIIGNDSPLSILFQLQGRMNVRCMLSSLHRKVEEMESSASLRILYGRIGAFIGVLGGLSGEPKGSPYITPTFGGTYAHTGSWMDSIEIFWSLRDIREAEGILSKIQSMSIHLSKEY